MWNRRILKEQGKINFKRYYWKSVLVSFILMLVTTGGIGGSSSSISSSISSMMESRVNDNYYDADEYYYGDEDDYYDGEYYSEDVSIDGESYIEPDFTMGAFFGGMIIIFIIIFIVALIIGLVIQFLVGYPIAIGANNFFMNTREKEGSLDSLVSVYKSGKLKDIILTMFLKGLYQFLWSLLLLIPGIVKSYEYRMIPYILCENPNISRRRAFEISKDMMRNNKWKTFVLDLSFLGWEILSLLTLGILGIFYVNPYVLGTNAELYAVLRENALKNGYASDKELIGFE